MQPLEIDITRHNPGVDPELDIWGLPIPLYLFVGGLTAGLMILSAARELRGGRPASAAIRLAPWVGFVALSAGMLALLVDLSHPLYVWRFFLAFEVTSPMSWGAWIVAAVFAALVAQGLGAFAPQEIHLLTRFAGPAAEPLSAAAELAGRYRREVLLASVALGVGLGVYTGVLLGTTPSRPLWNTAVLGPLFLTSGLSAAAAFLLLLPLDERERDSTAALDAGLMVAEAGVLTLFLVGLATGTTAQRAAAAALLSGPWAPPFWSLVVFVGLLSPLALEVVERVRHRPFLRLGPVLVLIGGLSLRILLVMAGQDLSLSPLP